jgi:hypothetical protein
MLLLHQVINLFLFEFNSQVRSVVQFRVAEEMTADRLEWPPSTFARS